MASTRKLEGISISAAQREAVAVGVDILRPLKNRFWTDQPLYLIDRLNKGLVQSFDVP
jgi:hypothetical protein